MDKVFPRDSDGNVLVLDHPNFNDTWAMMEMALATGKVKAIGVSNFSVKKYVDTSHETFQFYMLTFRESLEKLLETAKVVPAVNQVE